ncbi:DUF1707 SHOCT-like domain-containing protein [Nocardiopsis xinjiangensis]|uniref:DUF1707 SHOCT-like domain-containing protein n=1 Tax=Nocardiopsis xinjiangensis TaxID=124285 RepID=UPI00034C2168|nr:DUF1707 domain-containing protein [Nocardiopsis xinjiangensis]
MSDPRYLISDTERDEALRHLRTALEEGRFSVDEHGQRTQETLQARTNEDLRPLFDDLPQQLWPSTVGQPPAPTVIPPATLGTEDTAHHKKRNEEDEDEEDRERDTNFASLAGLGGFFFLIWGLPAMVNGSTGSVLAFLGFFFVFVLTPAAVQITRSFRDRRRGIEGA